jgi:hypothetical protein
MIQWMLSLRDPINVTGARIPGPFVNHTAVCHLRNTVEIATNATGSLVLTLSCSPYLTLSNFITYYNTVNLVDGTLGAAANTFANPFTAVTPVTGFSARTVSACIVVTPTAPLTTLSGTMTTATSIINSSGTDSFKDWDVIRDSYDAKTVQALSPVTWLYSPLDPTHLTFNTSSPTGILGTVLISGAPASTSYRFDIHMNIEFIPNKNKDFFDVKPTPIGDPNARAAFETVSSDTMLRAAQKSNPSFLKDVTYKLKNA